MKYMNCLRCENGVLTAPDIKKLKDWTQAYYYCETCGAKYEIVDDSGI